MTLNQILTLLLPKGHLGGEVKGSVDEAVASGVITRQPQKSRASIIREQVEARKRRAAKEARRARRRAKAKGSG